MPGSKEALRRMPRKEYFEASIDNTVATKNMSTRNTSGALKKALDRKDDIDANTLTKTSKINGTSHLKGSAKPAM